MVANVLWTWGLVESECKLSCKWHKFSLLFNDKGLLIGVSPISPSYWCTTGICHLKDICSHIALYAFQDLRTAFNLPVSSSFFYLQIKSALKPYDVPWQQPLPVHPYID